MVRQGEQVLLLTGLLELLLRATNDGSAHWYHFRVRYGYENIVGRWEEWWD